MSPKRQKVKVLVPLLPTAAPRGPATPGNTAKTTAAHRGPLRLPAQRWATVEWAPVVGNGRGVEPEDKNGSPKFGSEENARTGPARPGIARSRRHGRLWPLVRDVVAATLVCCRCSVAH